MTLTTPNCPVVAILLQEVQDKIRALDEVDSVELALTFEPAWRQDLMSEEAELALALL